MTRLFIAVFTVVLALCTAAPAQDSKVNENGFSNGTVELRIGVRRHARPFSYETNVLSSDLTGKSGPLKSLGFDGYMVAICDEVLRQMLITTEESSLSGRIKISKIVIEDVMAKRTEVTEDDKTYMALESDRKIPVRTRMDLLGYKIDILCDPATLTRDRVKRFAVSPPLFLTGIGYLTRQGYVQPGVICRENKSFIGLVGGTTANSHGVNEIIKAGEWRRVREKVISELRNGTGCGAVTDKNKNRPLISEFPSHDKAAEAFCKGEVDYYVGDLEIIQEHARNVYGCDIKRGAKTFTEDRYAIFAKYDYNNPTKALWIGRFFDILNREIYGEDSVVNQAYNATFERDSESRKLQLFFWGLSGSRY